jgi:hypothetical protein
MTQLAYALRQQQQKKRQQKEDEGGEWTKDDTIRCICDDNEEDGLMIQCDHCLCWLHCECVNISRNNIPERYKCDFCKKGKRSSSTTEQGNERETNDPFVQF